jgi:bifunctional non-homologous end joining protein LigD
MIKPTAVLSETDAEKLVKARIPADVQPMLATLTDDYFSNPAWIYERKLDGERCLIFKNGEDVRLLSRNHQDISSTYPELTESVASKVVKSFVADGEIVAFKNGRTSFSRLQQRMQVSAPRPDLQKKVAVYLYLFDLLYLEGYQTTDLPLRLRKKLLKQAIGYSDPLRFTIHRNECGETFFREACRKGWEGIIAKDGEAPYEHGRSQKWLKFKCDRRQELVVGGWTDPKGNRTGFGALLTGYYQDDDLVYAGKVGTGFSEESLKNLHQKLTEIERDTSPFDRGFDNSHNVHHVEPELVAEFAFSEWTEAGRLRHPRYLGLRRDKAPRQVHREG